ncbi:hypothetical protein QRX50_36825 [Amycolatopsis carbonis]|uniref:Uncharacterized protein n=1 Tax=Amycolatopsis carbonis TaxID=715471 RepID=A0A9Y2MQ85_9PSEU|nr:hypothetical protein [Amycolatopsis sp. 2-15]WIX76945.1 hypothetical protein QRX50_36825 [Amycolatopsis sp. 2-15]
MRFFTMGRTCGAALAAAVVAPLCLTSAAEAEPNDATTQVLAMTQQYLQDRADRVTDSHPVGFAASALTSAASTSQFSARMAAETTSLDRLRTTIAGTHADYRNAVVNLANPAVTVAGNTARVTVEERT